MSIIRGPRPSDNFAQVRNAAIEDGRMTAKARGVLVYLLSRPPGWSTSSEKLAASAAFQKEGRDAIRGALRELEEFGYLTRTRTNNADGKWSHDQMITDEPTMDGLSGAGETVVGSAVVGEPVDINKTESNNTDMSVPPSSSSSPSVTREDEPLNHADFFEKWWDTYPKSHDRTTTLAEYKNAYALITAKGITAFQAHETLLEAAKGYVRLCKAEQREVRYIKTSANWLREGNWQDKYPAPPKRTTAWQRPVAE